MQREMNISKRRRAQQLKKSAGTFRSKNKENGMRVAICDGKYAFGGDNKKHIQIKKAYQNCGETYILPNECYVGTEKERQLYRMKSREEKKEFIQGLQTSNNNGHNKGQRAQGYY